MLEWPWCQAFSTSIPAYAGLYLDADAEMPCKL